MSAEQLAHRLGVSTPAVFKLEKSEAAGTISLNTLEKAARALSCDLHVTFVPTRSLQEIVESRAREVAERIIARSDLHMALEDQGGSAQEREIRIREEADEMIRKRDKRIWDDT